MMVLPSFATSTCVSNSVQLTTALLLGEIQGQAYTIKIVQGSYSLSSGFDVTFSAPSTVEGGYTANCASRAVNAGNTVIDLQGNYFILRQLSGTPQALIGLDGLTLANGLNLYLDVGSYGFFSDDEGSIGISNVRVTDFAGWIQMGAVGNRIDVSNVLIDHLATQQNNIPVYFYVSEGGVLLIDHLTADLPGGSKVFFHVSGGSGHIGVYNSILWSSDGGISYFSGDLDSSTSLNLINDNFNHQSTLASVTTQNKLNVNPLWIDPASGNYRLQNVSPAINSGTLFSPGGEPVTDIEGNSRIIGSVPDRGAYEAPVSDFSTISVTNTLDSGSGSLREAITIANGSLSPPKLISFNIRNPQNVPICPAVIGLSSPLPTINGRMVIDGYTQPTSTRNTSDSGFNAHLCVVLKPASASLSNAFNVPANSFGSLVLRGLGIGGFNQPVRISGGQHSQIVGNQFGGTVGGVTLPGASLNAVLFGSNASGDILVGGNALGDRNLIGDAGQSGIDSQINATSSSFTTCSIVNNLIGMNRDGHTQLANTFGINVTGSGCHIAGNRIAGNAIVNLWINGGFSNVVQQNLIGVTNQDSGFLTNTTGILVTGNNNVIGAGGNGGSITANTVRYNVAGGVVIKGDSAWANSVNANRIFDNGSSNNGMDIDLVPTSGISGPTLNDETDFDSGVNDLQNYPVATGLVYTAEGSIDRPANLTAELASVPGTYRVDVYFSNAINTTGGRGHAEEILTHTTVQVPFSGTVSFSLPILVPNQSAGGVISLTATNSAGSTSEIGTALSTAQVPAESFSDGFE